MKHLSFVGAISVLAVLAVTIWFAWVFRPLLTPGTTVHLQDSHIGNWHFQVWQRKNATWTEPFSTALFVRHETNIQWLAVSLGHQDVFHPDIRLAQQGSLIAVLRRNVSLGNFNPSTGEYYRQGQTNFIYEGMTEKPSEWWVSP